MKKVLIIGFLFGTMIPIYLAMITANKLFAAPGLQLTLFFMGPNPTILASALINGVFYAIIFLIIYFLVRKLRNKTPTQTY
ncbi:MAG: hypothetical protein AAB677_02340 [Patescibacteria group bacterium]